MDPQNFKFHEKSFTILLITAKENENVQYPGPMVVLTTDRIR